MELEFIQILLEILLLDGEELLNPCLLCRLETLQFFRESVQRLRGGNLHPCLRFQLSLGGQFLNAVVERCQLSSLSLLEFRHECRHIFLHLRVEMVFPLRSILIGSD